MEQVTGYILVVLGLVLCVAQAFAMLRDLLAPRQQAAADAIELPIEDIVKLLLEKLPAAALGVLFVWLGSAILGWLA